MPHLIVTTLLILGCCLTLAKAVVAQTGDAGINVLVRDQFGGTIADATVVLEKAGTKAVTDKTDNSGRAVFTRLSGGEYRLSVTAQGFTVYKRESLVIRAGHPQSIEVVLDIAPIESSVDISQIDDLNPEKAGLATVLGEREVAELPDDPEELERTLKRIGQAVTGEDLPITVNGVEGGKVPPKAAIQQ
ncbi:MAG: carboxypeptidase-like regulatory domain-containing protein, partial [Acidobacteriota bacterium]